MDYVYTSQLLRLYMHALHITTSQSFLLFIYTVPILIICNMYIYTYTSKYTLSNNYIIVCIILLT